MKKIIALLLAALLLLSCVGSALADVYKDAGFIKKIPMKPKYTEEVENKGTVEKITYTCHAYALEAINDGKEIMVEKDMYVYLPYGYSADQDYNVIYLMHGGGEDEKYWLTLDRMGSGTLAMLDNINFKGDCEPTIIVTPTTNTGTILGEQDEDLKTRGEGHAWHWKELREDIIPLIETKYATFAHGDVSPENLKATREHRAFAGFSMGSITACAVAIHDFDLFAYFGNFSGAKTEVADYVAALTSEEFKDLPFKFWYNGNGTVDQAHDEHDELCHGVLEALPDRLEDGVNFCWIDFKGGAHAYGCWLPDLYNCMRVFFKQ